MPGLVSNQTGEATFSNTQTTLNISISSVDFTRCRLNVQVRGASAQVNDFIGYGVTIKPGGSSTQITLQRWGTDNSALTVRWTVLEYDATFSAQHISTSITSTPYNLSISAVDTAKTYSCIQVRSNGLSTFRDCFISDNVINSTTVRLTHNGTASAASDSTEVHVYECSTHSVQSVSGVTGLTNPLNVSISAVTLTESMSECSFWDNGTAFGGNNVKNGLLNGPTNFQIGCYVAIDQGYHFYVISDPGFTVQRGLLVTSSDVYTYSMSAVVLANAFFHLVGQYSCWQAVNSTIVDIQQFGITNKSNSTTQGQLDRSFTALFETSASTEVIESVATVVPGNSAPMKAQMNFNSLIKQIA